MLNCPGCWQEFPIVDGVPVIVADVRGYVAQSAASLLLRDDLDPLLASLVSDCCGPGSTFEVVRQHLSNYTWGHYADLDPSEPSDPPPGALVRLLARGLELSEELGPNPAGPRLAAGCSVGRDALELARAAPSELVLGLDLNLPMLRLGQRALRSGEVRYPRRRCGIVYEERALSLPDELRQAGERVDLWAADATALPFAAGAFALVTSLNLIDCVSDPRGHLASVKDALAPGGRAIVATPHDWSANATAPEAWLGGHSQRGPQGGACEPVLRALLTPGGHPATVPGLELRAEDDDVPWLVRLHERSHVRYRAQLLVAERVAE